MKKINTLKKNYEFKNVFSKGKFLLGKYIIVYFKKNKKNENFVGIAVGTKIGTAVQRNQIKRVIRESYRIKKDKLKKGYDIVFLFNKNCKELPLTFNKVDAEMTKLLKKSEML